MTELLKNDIKALDFIIHEVLFKNSVSEHDLVENGLISSDLKINFQDKKSESPTKEFNRLIFILKEYNVCNITSTSDADIIEPNESTLTFQKNGGFKKLFKESKLKSKRENLEFDLAKSNIEANKLNKKIAKRNKTETIINIILGLLNIGILIWQVLKSE